jgi:hypothetical protein
MESAVQSNSSQLRERSTFVTVLSWLLICFAALGVLGSLMQVVLVTLVMPSFPALQQGVSAEPVAVQDFALTAMRVLVLVMFALALCVLFSAIALLKRKNWARRTFVVLFALGSAWNILVVVGVVAGLLSGFAVPNPPGGMPQNMQTVFSTMFGVLGVFACAMAVLFAWIAIRLHSPLVKTEFIGVAAA